MSIQNTTSIIPVAKPDSISLDSARTGFYFVACGLAETDAGAGAGAGEEGAKAGESAAAVGTLGFLPLF